MGPDPVPESHQGVELVIQSIARAAGLKSASFGAFLLFVLSLLKSKLFSRTLLAICESDKVLRLVRCLGCDACGVVVVIRLVS